MHVSKQITRYAMVGLVSNAIVYVLYLLVTWLGTGHKTAMTCLYVIGVLQTFVFNRSWSFRYDGASMPALVRYAIAYALGYVVNLLALLVLVDHVGLPHQLVQGVMILVVAAMLFIAQRYWVFPSQPKGKAA